MTVDPRNTLRNALQTLWTTADGAGVIAEDAVFSVAWPVNELVGRDAIVENFITPIRNEKNELCAEVTVTWDFKMKVLDDNKGK